MITSMQVYKGQQPTMEELAELNALDNRPIDYSDIPETTPEEAVLAKKFNKTKLKIENTEAFAFA